MEKITPNVMHTSFVTYLLQDENNQDVFIFWCKYVDVLKISAAMKNPAFDPTKTYNIYIMGFHARAIDAMNAMSRLMNERGMPAQNKTHEFNRIGNIKCNEDGYIYRNQAEIVRRHGVDASALSNHLKRKPGFKTVGGKTYSRACYLDNNVKPTEKTPAPLAYIDHRAQYIRCIDTGQVYNSQAEACSALGINSAQLSQHLNRHKGYAKVKGLTFERIAAPEGITTPINYRAP